MQQIIEVGGRLWRITKHALERALDMQIEGHEICAALDHPDEIAESIKYPGSKHYKLGNIALSISFDKDIPTICTIVWANREAWQADLLRAPCEGRYIPSPDRTES